MHVDLDNAHSLCWLEEENAVMSPKRLFLFASNEVGLLDNSSFSGIYATIR